MKRIRIWINSLNLLEQFLMVSFLTMLVFVVFFMGFVDQNINTFTDEQMFDYVHNSQSLFISNENISNHQFDDTNVYHFVYSKKRSDYISSIGTETENVISQIDPVVPADGVISSDDNHIIYSVCEFGDDYSLVSIVKNEYRNSFKRALLKGMVDITLIMMMSLFLLFMIWIVSLIKPLNQIRNYINRLRKGDSVTLIVKRQDEIGEVAEALEEMNSELSRQKKIREEMIQNISHDLKTPIATIKSYSESIKDGIYPYDTLEKSVDVIIEHAERLEKKVHRLISFNKYGYMHDAPEDEEVLMSSVVEKAILSCAVLRNDVNIETDIEPDVYFHGEEEPWRVVVENLVENALRYAGSVVRITITKNQLEVFNDGTLMTKERISKLFKPYEKGTKGNFGLGLSIVKKITETYGYDVVGENMDNGVVFRITKTRKNARKISKV